VLADVLHYVNTRHTPKFMIDLATLTGAIIVALARNMPACSAMTTGCATG